MEYTEAQKARVSAVITDALKRGSRSRTHPAAVAADRLGDAMDKWPEAFDGATRDAVGLVRHVLNEIALDEEWRP